MRTIDNSRFAILRGVVCSVAVVAIGSAAYAKTDVEAKVQQLKDNADASKGNLDQYEDGLKTIQANLADTEKALKQVAAEKKNLARQTADAKKGKQTADIAKTQIEGYMKTENEKMAVETQQIEQLKAAIAKLEANVQERQQNIAKYKAKLTNSDAQAASWQKHNQQATDLETALNDKEAQILAEKKRLEAKKIAYEQEAAKWRKQVRISDRDYANYANLKN